MLAQHRFKGSKAAIFLAFAAGLALSPAPAGTIDTGPQAPDPILTGAAPGPCQPAPAGADYVGGTDVLGNAVAPVDAGSNRIGISMASDTVIPEVLTHLPSLDRVRVQIHIDGIAGIVAPSSACPNLAPLRSPR